jgi:RNA polymerase sigma-70 factor (ECF subfamily)
MSQKETLAERFEANRGHLRSVAFRMLGSHGEADDAVQEAWMRLARTDVSSVDNLRAWLTTVVARVCLDMLRARKIRREEPIDNAPAMAAGDDAARDVELADSVGIAMLVVLERLSPAARVAFVLHDMFSLPFDHIAPILNRSPATARQLALRARRRVQGAPANAEVDRARQREVVSAFLAAARGGDFSALLAVLDPDVVLRADAASVAASLARAGAGDPVLAPEVHGHENVATTFRGSLKMAQPALVDGDVGLVFAFGGRPRAVVDILVENGRILEISMIADPRSVAEMELEF